MFMMLSEACSGSTECKGEQDGRGHSRHLDFAFQGVRRASRGKYAIPLYGAAKLKLSSVSFVPATPFHQDRPKTKASWMGFPLDASPLNFDQG
jgi:hypothetical protein